MCLNLSHVVMDDRRFLSLVMATLLRRSYNVMLCSCSVTLSCKFKLESFEIWRWNRMPGYVIESTGDGMWEVNPHES